MWYQYYGGYKDIDNEGQDKQLITRITANVVLFGVDHGLIILVGGLLLG